MSDQNTVTQTDHDSHDSLDKSGLKTPNAEAGQTAATQAAEPAAQPFATFPDAKSFNARISRETRKALNAQAKAAGFDDWDHMNEAVSALRQTPPVANTPENAQEGPGATQTSPQVQNDQGEAKRLKMALSVASELNLPPTLVERLVGNTPEEMTADANRLLALFQQPARGPGIPSAPRQNQPVTFTRTQLQEPKFVREHIKEIQQAQREGRIVSS